MGCCKSRGGMFGSAEEHPELAGVPLKYRKALASGDGKALGKVFSQECGDIMKESEGEFAKILADINGMKKRGRTATRSVLVALQNMPPCTTAQ